MSAAQEEIPAVQSDTAVKISASKKKRMRRKKRAASAAAAAAVQPTHSPQGNVEIIPYPPYTYTDPVTGQPQYYGVVSYDISKTKLNRKQISWFHGAFPKSQYNEAEAFAKRLRRDWNSSIDVGIIVMGRPIVTPRPASTNASCKVIHEDNAELTKILNQSREETHALKRMNAERIRQFKKEAGSRLRNIEGNVAGM